jgi:chemotaxis protein methyltransferase CheR
LREAMPRLGLAWPGFRRVRGQVVKRLRRRAAALGLTGPGGPDAYRRRLARDPDEWAVLDACCRITVSRFFRDREVFEALAEPLAQLQAPVRAWSAGCASGEEPYSVVILWHAAGRPGFGLEVIATDADERMLDRARAAVYPRGTLRELPPAWRAWAFEDLGGTFRLRPELRRSVSFLRQDLRREAPPGPFRLVLCRNLAFTYFDAATTRAALVRLEDRLAPGGLLVIGRRERLPEPHGLVPAGPGIYEKPGP